jgi:hypothetical protein
MNNPSHSSLPQSYLLTCDNCYAIPTESITINNCHRYYAWAHQVECASCVNSWFVCNSCPSLRKRLKTNRQLSDHNYNCHSAPKRHSFCTTLMDNTFSANWTFSEPFDAIEDSDSIGVVDVEISTMVPPHSFTSISEGPPIMNLSGVHIVNYFSNQLNALGAAYIVSYSQFKLPNVAREMDETDVKFHLAVASLLTQVTSGQCKQLAPILKLATDVIEKQRCDEMSRSSWRTQIPYTSSLMRSLYVEGKYAMLPNLTTSPVFVVDDHACTRLKDCIADLLGHGVLVDIIQPPTVHGAGCSNVRGKLSDSTVTHNIFWRGKDCMKQLLSFACTLLNGVMHLNHQSQQSPIGARFGLKSITISPKSDS